MLAVDVNSASRSPAHRRNPSDGYIVDRNLRSQNRTSPYASPANSPKVLRKNNPPVVQCKELEEKPRAPLEQLQISLTTSTTTSSRAVVECAICQGEMEEPTVSSARLNQSFLPIPMSSPPPAVHHRWAVGARTTSATRATRSGRPGALSSLLMSTLSF